MRNLVEWLSAAPPNNFVYTSSTSVYGQNDGSLVEETSPTEPAVETGKILVETERVLLAAAQEEIRRRSDALCAPEPGRDAFHRVRDFAGKEWDAVERVPTRFRGRRFPAVILRLAGIYGPDRGYWFGQYVNKEARIEGDGSRILNMIHRDDVIGAIIAALKCGQPGQIYNAVDNEPVTQLAFFKWLSGALGGELPPSVPEAPEAVRKRGLTNKKVSNLRLRRELGYQFKYPTFREGYTAEILRLTPARESITGS